jgi:transposase-like protein
MTNPADQDRDPSTALSVRFPDIAARWHPARNEGVDPALVSYASKRKAWWVCPTCHYEWQATVGSRTRGHGCPLCARSENGRARSLPDQGKSLAELLPALAAQWHPTLNGGLGPEMVAAASNKRVWWQCDSCGNEWQVQICNRTRGSGCRRCAMTAKRVPRPGQSLAAKRPSLAAEWHPSLNKPLTPADVTFSAKGKAWWRGVNCGHEWQAAVGNRAAGAGCPICARSARSRSRGERSAARSDSPGRQKPGATGDGNNARPTLSFAARFPDAAAEWHPVRNGDLKPNAVGYASNRRVWWLCAECGHEWEAVINSRGKGGVGCSPCGRRRAGKANSHPKTGNSLAERFPGVAAQWHPNRNGDLTPKDVAAKSGRRVWWLCAECSNEWEVPIFSRANGYGCKQCATRKAAELYRQPNRASAAGGSRSSLAERYPGLAVQWHPTRNGDLTPSAVTGSSGQKVWWKCDFGHEWQAYINNRVRVSGCPKCTLWGTSEEEIRLRQELVAAGVPIDDGLSQVQTTSGKDLYCDMVSPSWRVVIEFDGNRFHKLLSGRAKDECKTRLLEEAGWTVIRVREALTPIGTHDVVVPLFSDEVTRAKATLTKLSDMGYLAAGYDDYMKTASPWGSANAAHEVARRLRRSLATENPELAAQWHPIKNDRVTPHNVSPKSGRKVWWQCDECGFSWQAVVGSRARGHGCPDCGRRASLKHRSTPRPGHSLAERFPTIAAQLHPTKNAGLTADSLAYASGRTAWWLGPCGHEWQAVVSKRTLRRTGCPRGCKAS